jgi:hypothetical protein
MLVVLNFNSNFFNEIPPDLLPIFVVNPISIPLLITFMLGATTVSTPMVVVTTLLLEECEDDTHTPEMGTWESTGTPETSEFDCRGQNTLH